MCTQVEPWLAATCMPPVPPRIYDYTYIYHTSYTVQVEPWLAALEAVLGDPHRYQQLSQRCRRAALEFVGDGPGELRGFLEWARQISRGSM